MTIMEFWIGNMIANIAFILFALAFATSKKCSLQELIGALGFAIIGLVVFAVTLLFSLEYKLEQRHEIIDNITITKLDSGRTIVEYNNNVWICDSALTYIAGNKHIKLNFTYAKNIWNREKMIDSEIVVVHE